MISMSDLCISLRYFDRDRVENFYRKGEIYLASLEYFRKLESDKNNNGIADHREGSSAQYISKSTSFIVKIAGDNKEVISTSHKDGKNSINIYPDRSNAWGIWCFTNLELGDHSLFNHAVIRKEPTRSLEAFCIKKRFLNKLVQSLNVGSNNRIPVIFKSSFNDRLHELGGGFTYKVDDVAYYFEKQPPKALAPENNPEDYCFFKPNRYAVQHERRVLIPENLNGKRVQLLGDLRKVVIPLFDWKLDEVTFYLKKDFENSYFELYCEYLGEMGYIKVTLNEGKLDTLVSF